MGNRPFTRGRLVVLALLALLLFLPPLAEAIDRSFYVGVATRILIFAIAAVSLDLILGYGGMVSFGHAAFLGIGAYVVGILFTHQFNGTTILGLPGTVNGFIVLPLAALVGGLFALVIGAICLRTDGIYFIMITLAFAQMLYFLFTGLRAYGGADGIALWTPSQFAGVVDLNDRWHFYYLTLALLLGFLYLCRRLVGSRFGRVIRGSKENDRRMRALGYPTYRYKLAAFALSGAAAGLAGALLANATLFVGPSYLAWTRSGDLIVMVVLGGMGTLAGPVFGAAAFLLLEEFLPQLLDGLWDGLGDHWKLFLGPILILIVLFARRGLYGLVEGRRGGAR
ncbi:branched-chain amino acid ABC transporter permease [Inquilinus sp. CAU 1745]|uniref:branched-chain amino acid ABC transporter permease n=1 Tax=Inquilinus sp. CAU 1745 TaxID=3140369 RepID=UPI00325B38EB